MEVAGTEYMETTGVQRTWPEDWEQRKAGRDCPFCAEGRPERNDYGVRIFRSANTDGYLQRFTPVPGYTIVVWRGRHVPNLTDLSDEEALAYQGDVLTVARALRQHFQPAQLTCLVLNLQIPHLHTNVVPRYVTDSAPGGVIDLNHGDRVEDEVLDGQARDLRELMNRVKRQSG